MYATLEWVHQQHDGLWSFRFFFFYYSLQTHFTKSTRIPPTNIMSATSGTIEEIDVADHISTEFITFIFFILDPYPSKKKKRLFSSFVLEHLIYFTIFANFFTMGKKRSDHCRSLFYVSLIKCLCVQFISRQKARPDTKFF